MDKRQLVMVGGPGDGMRLFVPVDSTGAPDRSDRFRFASPVKLASAAFAPLEAATAKYESVSYRSERIRSVSKYDEVQDVFFLVEENTSPGEAIQMLIDGYKGRR